MSDGRNNRSPIGTSASAGIDADPLRASKVRVSNLFRQIRPMTDAHPEGGIPRGQLRRYAMLRRVPLLAMCGVRDRGDVRILTQRPADLRHP